MPETPASSHEREAARWAAARRREAANTLRLAAMMAAYSADRVANGAGPAEARQVVWEAAGELEQAVAALRKLSWPSRSERRQLAVLWAAAGMSRVEIGRRLGISYRTARYYAKGARSSSC